jgi:hypothetical protein
MDQRASPEAGTTGQVTDLLLQIRGGNTEAMDQLVPLVSARPSVPRWRDRGHFMVVAALAMRRILVDYARRNRAVRRGGGSIRFTLDHDVPAEERGEMLLALDEALETAEVLGVTRRTVQRDWVKARGWLPLEMNR